MIMQKKGRTHDKNKKINGSPTGRHGKGSSNKQQSEETDKTMIVRGLNRMTDSYELW